MVIQISAWMASGLYFAIFPIETIRAEHLAVEPEALQFEQLEGLVPPDVAGRAVLKEFGEGAQLTDVSLSFLDRQVRYRVAGLDARGQKFVRLVDDENGLLLPFLGKNAVIEIANNHIVGPASFISAELITEAPAGSEYRGRSLPLWQVNYSQPESLSVYVDGWTGEIVARRTTRWRIFDFLWMLHIMDFDERDDFNTLLLQVSAALGLILALTGLVYWALSTKLFRKRRMPI